MSEIYVVLFQDAIKIFTDYNKFNGSLFIHKIKNSKILTQIRDDIHTINDKRKCLEEIGKGKIVVNLDFVLELLSIFYNHFRYEDVPSHIFRKLVIDFIHSLSSEIYVS